MHVFSACASERQEGDVRVVTLAHGTEVREATATVDEARMRAVYTVPGLLGAEHHQAEMRGEPLAGGIDASWCTDVLPDVMAEWLRETYVEMFLELVAAVEQHAAAS